MQDPVTGPDPEKHEERIYMNTKEEYWFWLCNIKDIYQDSIHRLLKAFTEPEEIYKASEDQLIASGAVDRIRARAIVSSKSSSRCLYRLEKLKMDGTRFIYYGGEDYPERFMNLEDKPYAFYVKGELPNPAQPTAGIVGARNCSAYGKEMALKFSQTLAASGIQIVSGLALGVDTYASKGALEAGGKTFVVLGSGLDVIYPTQNIELYYQIIMQGGGIISEFPAGTLPAGWHFPHRNRLISALSDKLLVIEARRHSGTLSTASHALAQGKDIYALPGRITDPMSEGCNRMIADGAGVLLDPSYLLEAYYGSGYADSLSVCGTEGPVPEGNLGKVYAALDYSPKIIDQIVSDCGLPAEETYALLSELELEGLCSQVTKDYYVKGA